MGRIDIDGLAETPFAADRTEPNGTSIAFLAEFHGRRALFAADAHADRLEQSLQPIASAEGGRVRLDAFKLPHHGSQHNVSPRLLDLVDCQRYLVSTDGSHFGHPDPVAIARVLKYGGDEPDLIFNYRSAHTSLWDEDSWKERYGYRTTYPPPSENGTVAVDLSP
jgi:hypothetical protein